MGTRGHPIELCYWLLICVKSTIQIEFTVPLMRMEGHYINSIFNYNNRTWHNLSIVINSFQTSFSSRNHFKFRYYFTEAVTNVMSSTEGKRRVKKRMILFVIDPANFGCSRQTGWQFCRSCTPYTQAKCLKICIGRTLL